MVNIFLKRAIGVAILAGVSVGANATTTALGQVSSSVPTTFTGSVLGSQQSFSDIFTFTLSQPNVASGYSVVNFPLDLGNAGSLGTVLSTMSLVTFGTDGLQGTGDDHVLKSVVLPSTGNTQDHLSLSWDQPITGPAYLILLASRVARWAVFTPARSSQFRRRFPNLKLMPCYWLAWVDGCGCSPPE